MFKSIMRFLLVGRPAVKSSMPAPSCKRDLSIPGATEGLWTELPIPHVVLFLDFDGVLHRCANDSLEHVPLLEQVLEECPHLYLVVSSDWRRTCSIAYLQSVFSPAYRHRVIGATSVFGASVSGHIRQEECESFANEHNIQAFMCVDDEARLFSANWPKLIKTDYYTGLTDGEAFAISRRYAVLIGR